MNKQKLLEYLKETPENINMNCVENWLDELEVEPKTGNFDVSIDLTSTLDGDVQFTVNGIGEYEELGEYYTIHIGFTSDDFAALDPEGDYSTHEFFGDWNFSKVPNKNKMVDGTISNKFKITTSDTYHRVKVIEGLFSVNDGDAATPSDPLLAPKYLSSFNQDFDIYLSYKISNE